jgi:hypothetical protein
MPTHPSQTINAADKEEKLIDQLGSTDQMTTLTKAIMRGSSTEVKPDSDKKNMN